MPILERNGARIAYDVTGEGPVVLLGHSLLCGRWMWDGVAPKLAEKYKVVNAEFRGHHASTCATPYTMDDLADDWLALLDELGADKAALVGLSMGGMTAMRVALRAPERVSALVLMDSSADREPWIKRLKYRIMTWLYRRNGFNDSLLKQIAPIMFGSTTMRSRPELVEQLAAHLREHDRAELIRVINAVVRRNAMSPIEAIKAPTLVLVGEQDAATVPARSEAIARRIHGATLVRIPDAGHLSALEQPDRVAQATLDFLGTSWGHSQPSNHRIP